MTGAKNEWSFQVRKAISQAQANISLSRKKFRYLAQQILCRQPKQATKPDNETATSRVLNTHELLENILLYVPPASLLCHTQRVCYLWRDIIRTSKPLQQALFFRPYPQADRKETSYKVNPLLLSRLSAPRSDTDTECYYNLGPRNRGHPSRLRPRGRSLSSEDIDLENDYPLGDSSAKVLMEIDWGKLRSDEVFGRAEASWLQMLPVQPLVPDVWYIHRNSGYWGRDVQEERRDMHRPEGDGKRLGDLYRTVRELEDDEWTVRTRTMIVTSQRYGLMVVLNIWRVDGEYTGDVLSDEEIPRRSTT